MSITLKILALVFLIRWMLIITLSISEYISKTIFHTLNKDTFETRVISSMFCYVIFAATSAVAHFIWKEVLK